MWLCMAKDVLVFNKRGYPIGQILMPGRDDGKMLRTTHPGIPGTNQLIICTNDIENHSEGGSCFIQLMVLLKDMRVINFNKL